jgi:NAD-dependent SIR2 family protein deacetylase
LKTNNTLSDDKSIQSAAYSLEKARCVLILTGAGMSADSGIPTFRDNGGFWNNFRPFAEKGLNPVDLASPRMFRKKPEYAWAFYEWRRRNILDNKPHSGFTIINKWMNELFQQSFIQTTNTDGLHLISGTDKKKVFEQHGSIWELQCLKPCCKEFWKETTYELCKLDYDKMEADNLPKCKNCQRIARPRIMMFGDAECIEKHSQYHNYYEFIRKYYIDITLIIGSNGWLYPITQNQRKSPIVININPDEDIQAQYNSNIQIVGGAEESLNKINDLLYKPQ